jgi:hypothetical protein
VIIVSVSNHENVTTFEVFKDEDYEKALYYIGREQRDAEFARAGVILRSDDKDSDIIEIDMYGPAGKIEDEDPGWWVHLRQGWKDPGPPDRLPSARKIL